MGQSRKQLRASSRLGGVDDESHEFTSFRPSVSGWFAEACSRTQTLQPAADQQTSTEGAKSTRIRGRFAQVKPNRPKRGAPVPFRNSSDMTSCGRRSIDEAVPSLRLDSRSKTVVA